MGAQQAQVVQAKPGQAQPMQPSQVVVGVAQGGMMNGLPNGVPAGSQLILEKYVGSKTRIFACGGCLLCGCLACLILACPIDEREVYVAPNGQKYTFNGARITE